MTFDPTKEDLTRDIVMRVKDAIDHTVTVLEPNWEKAEKYYDGGSSLKTYAGRSQVIKTEMRDAIRNTMPSILRTLLQARKIVEYTPSHPVFTPWIDQQAEYVTQLFWKNDGYRQLYNALEESAKLKRGVLLTDWNPDPKPKFSRVTNVTYDVVSTLIADETVTILEMESDDEGLYDVSYLTRLDNGQILFQSVPTYQFFIDEYSCSIAESEKYGVHGHRCDVTVAEAKEMGLEYDKWDELNAEDPETADHGGSSRHRRGYAKTEDREQPDPEKHKFLLTQAIASVDLEDAGYPQLYRFYFGGTDHRLLDYERIEFSPYDLVNLNLKAHATDGHSFYDLTHQDQDAASSLLRATIDNAHAANNPKHAANPRLTEFKDLRNTSLNAPVRTKEQIQTIAIPFTGQGLLGLLQYMDMGIQNKTGVTKAAQGLDPDAMQSTDKQAVMNTIVTSQGQVELMVRNVVECTLIPVFNKMLRLATAHFSPIQVMRSKGVVIPVNLQYFDTDAIATARVGLGTARSEQKKAALGFILQKQEGYIEQYGLQNPFTSLAQIYNTLEDLLELDGVTNLGRYLNIVTPQMEAQFAQQQAQQAQEAAKSAPADPSRTLLAIEQGKRNVEMLDLAHKKEESTLKILNDILALRGDIDIKRDRLVQDRVIDAEKADQDRIKAEQEANNDELPDPQRIAGARSPSPERPGSGGPVSVPSNGAATGNNAASGGAGSPRNPPRVQRSSGVR